jgi:predicted lipoprotein with Yx(FWY)xxD motif
VATGIALITSVTVVTTAALAVVAGWAGAATTTTTAAGATGTVISAETSPYGEVLMVGSGQFAGYSVYQFDRNTPSACTASVITVQKMPLSCAGLETDKTADWPAVTTVGKPVAGPGVDKHLLGMVYRKDLGADQVTYGGKLLYLFDIAPHQFTGVNFLETVAPLPPWHGLWWLVSPKGGEPVTGPIQVTTQTGPNGATVLAVDLFQGQGTTAVIVYDYSKDPKGHSACTGECALTWIPVLTSAPPDPGTGVPKSALGETRRTDDTEQLTFNGKPLYIYSEEVPQLNPTNGNPLDPATVGTGNGLHGPKPLGGTFAVVPATATS